MSSRSAGPSSVTVQPAHALLTTGATGVTAVRWAPAVGEGEGNGVAVAVCVASTTLVAVGRTVGVVLTPLVTVVVAIPVTTVGVVLSCRALVAVTALLLFRPVVAATRVVAMSVAIVVAVAAMVDVAVADAVDCTVAVGRAVVAVAGELSADGMVGANVGGSTTAVAVAGRTAC